ncbi:hypothetical protein D3C72_2239360 [compost metagenome]
MASIWVTITAPGSVDQVVTGIPATGTRASPRQSDRPRAITWPALTTRSSTPPSASPLPASNRLAWTAAQLAPRRAVLAGYMGTRWGRKSEPSWSAWAGSASSGSVRLTVRGR